ncbi:hypothetical protein ACEZCY_15360 [Streptacidiphilus sp. N1-12]|uniref:Uncharacterized protein n=2 Tax=Streptacidiphilus alkalitolerans TaxID=3342712 RepID=A0ABV6WEY3_9ACTN
MVPNHEQPGIRIYAPTWYGAPPPEADYVCRCGRSETAFGQAACRSLIDRFHTDHDAHMAMSYTELHAMNLAARSPLAKAA